jgi:Gram-negative bacterial TonB protein C-terminal
MRTTTLRSALLFAAACTFFCATAANPATPLRTKTTSRMERELDRQLDKYVTYPLLERNKRMDGEVLVSFVIDATGKVKVISAESENPELRDYVLRMLSKVDIGQNPDGSWKTTHVRFAFHPEV